MTMTSEEQRLADENAKKLADEKKTAEDKAAADKAAATKSTSDKAAADRAAAQDKVAAEKASAVRSASEEGAKSVAEAVKKVAEAAVAEIQKTKVAVDSGDFRFSGTPGGRFRIEGAGLSSGGTVTLNGAQLFTTEWSTQSITGNLPANATPGEVIVHIDSKTSQRGRFVR